MTVPPRERLRAVKADIDNRQAQVCIERAIDLIDRDGHDPAGGDD
jgi:hypothetical protein